VNFYYYYELIYSFDGTVSKTKGVTYGNSWAEVMQNLVEYYGENDICEICYLRPIGEGGTCIEVDEMQKIYIKRG
jgi:hypothetical protein